MYADIDCGELEPPANGAVNVSGTTYNSTATYSCDEGYVLVGVSTSTCLGSGNWSNGDVVECTRKRYASIGTIIYALK